MLLWMDHTDYLPRNYLKPDWREMLRRSVWFTVLAVYGVIWFVGLFTIARLIVEAL